MPRSPGKGFKRCAGGERRALEELAISLACERITDEKIAELKDALEQFRTVIKGKDVTKIAQMDVAFHDVIFEATQNARLVQMVNNLREQMYRYRLEYLKDFSTHSRLDEEHVKIFEAVSARGYRACHCTDTRTYLQSGSDSCKEHSGVKRFENFMK